MARSLVDKRAQMSSFFHSHVPRARKLSMNPAKVGNLYNPRQAQGKLFLPPYIEEPCFKPVGKTVSERLLSWQERACPKPPKNNARRTAWQRQTTEPV